MTFSVILPTYNEAENIVLLIRAIKKNLHSFPFEIIAVDDNSPDSTAKIVKKHFSTDTSVDVIIRVSHRGLAQSILEGIKKSRGRYVIIMDTDFNHDPKDLGKLTLYMHTHDIVLGSRYVKGGGMENNIRFLFSMIYNKFIQLLLGLKTRDNLSGYFIIRRACLRKLDLKGIFIGYGDYFIRLLKAAHSSRLRIKEIPVFYKNRPAGKSKSFLIPMLIDYSKTVFSLINSK